MEESKRNLTNHAKWLGAAAVEPGDPSRLPFHNVESTEKGRIRLVRHGWCADLLGYLLKGAENMPIHLRADDRFRKNLHDCDQLV